MAIEAVITVPAAPLVLPEVSANQPADIAPAVAALRQDVAEALATLPENGTVVTLARGDELLIHHARLATLASYGRPDVASDLVIGDDASVRIGARGQAPRVHAGRLDGDLAVLALLLAASRPKLRLVPVSVPDRADPVALTAVAAGIHGALTDLEGPVAIVAAGDLAATLSTDAPGYLVEGADQFDVAVRDAVERADPDALHALGAEDARRVQARGWAPLVVATVIAAANHRVPQWVRYHAPRGVGQLVAA